MIQAVIGQTTTVLVEERVPPLQGVEEAREIRDIHITGGFELIHPGVESFRLMHGQRLVRPIRRINTRATAGCGERFVIAEVIRSDDPWCKGR